MALATVYATIPAVVAAAVGIYSFGGGVRSSMGSLLAKANQKVQTTVLPKVAPQFDGLNCFETLVEQLRSINQLIFHTGFVLRVRYESRKKLAERRGRPGIEGQLVLQQQVDRKLKKL